MKAPLFFTFMFAATLSVVSAQAPTAPPVSLTGENIPVIAKKGDRLRLQTINPLMDDPGEMTVLSLGPAQWVLLEYERTFLKPGESGAKKEKAQMWVNFDHVIAAKKISEPAK